MQVEYAAKEIALERSVYEIRDGSEPDYSEFHEFYVLPSELPRLGHDFGYVYTIDLDREVLSINHSIHWKLTNIPRQVDPWLRAIADCIYPNNFTISPNLCPEEYLVSLDLELPERNGNIAYDFRVVYPKANIGDVRKAFLTYVLANTIIGYKEEIIRYGREWGPASFPFRELVFALVSIASDQAKFRSFPAQHCDPRACSLWRCESNHLGKLPGWLTGEWVEKWASDDAPLLEFGSSSHRPGEPPGVSPIETKYWMGDVLVSLALSIDGDAVSKAVTWGIEQGRSKFQIVVISLFEVIFAEVSVSNGMGPFIQISDPVYLSPLRKRYGLSTHVLERPEATPGMTRRHRRGVLILNSDCTGTVARLQGQFPGLAALVNFFEVAASRQAASKPTSIFPPELYDMILDFVDYDTWKTCLLVSTVFRSSCIRKYRVDDRTRIVAGPFRRIRRHRYYKGPLMCFDFENIQTGQILPMMSVSDCYGMEEFNWMPVIGSSRKALMLDANIQFEPAGDVPVEADEDTWNF